ncbi:MAG TPA: cellulase family glycosylhydrolase [Candidatus Dormibacteraeota bacterium]|nr:cellulase family glycosylhydrolase [Candidatus Dormibacteraeota bacterium]
MPDPRNHRRRWPRRLGLGILILVLLLVIDAYLPSPALTAKLPPAIEHAAVGGLDWLRTQGGVIVDSQDRKVLLRGFNVDALVSYPKDPPAPFGEADAIEMERAGFDVVRLGIDWSQLEPTRGRIDQRYLDRVASTVDLCNRHGLYVVLDMHFRLGWSPRFGYSGAPAWATLTVPNWNPLPRFSWSPALSPAAIASDTYFWLSDDWKRDFFKTWQAVARRFKDDPGVAGYDIFNEAHPLPIPPRIFEKSYLWPLFQHAIEAIGSADANHLFFTEGILLLGLNTAVVQLKARNVVYGTHVYEGSLVPPFWTGDPTYLDTRFRQRASEAAAVPAPLWVGEMGYDWTQPGALSYADAALDEADRLGIGWAWWLWRENRYWGIVDAAGRLVNRNALRHLARPYIVAAPAGVRAGLGDGVHGRLQLQVDQSHAPLSLVVGWSALTLGAPVAAGTCLASSQWDPATGRLALELDPGAGCRISITASG